MSSAALSPAPNNPTEDLQVLRRLPALLLREGYIDTYTVFGTFHLHFERVREQLDALPQTIRTLMALFFLNQTVSQRDLEQIFSTPEIDALRRLGIFLMVDGGINTGGLLALPVSGMLMFVPLPHVNQTVYFGEDSAALVSRLSPPRGARCVDFCSGPGIQALRSAQAGGKVVAVEINPLAIATAELNLFLNSLEDRIEIRRGDLHHALRPGERFDFVSANPPLLPFVPDLPYPFVGHGGADGLAVTRRILGKLPEILTENGTAQIIGTCLGNSEGPAPRAELERYAHEHRLKIVMTVPARLPLRPGTPMFDGLSWTCAAAGSLDEQNVRERFARHLESLEADSLYTFFLTVSKGSSHPGLLMTEHFRRPGGFWFR